MNNLAKELREVERLLVDAQQEAAFLESEISELAAANKNGLIKEKQAELHRVERKIRTLDKRYQVLEDELYSDGQEEVW